jgi:hypothetical protein
MDIPGLSTLYAILKRNIDRENDLLSQRKELAAELAENCKKWSEVLIETFDEAVRRWQIEGRQAAEREIMAQERDFMKLNYSSLEKSSPILLFLSEDKRFEPFAEACTKFYRSALSLKRLVYGGIEDYPGHYVTENEVGIAKMAALWRREVKQMLREVARNHMRVRVLPPK